MRPQRPYLLRAFYDWLLDSQLTPLIVVNANYNHVDVPNEFIRDGQIILNIAPHAVGQFNMNDEAISFSARFAGVPRSIYVPMGALLAIYARENGAGTLFSEEEAYLLTNENALAETTQNKVTLVESDESENLANMVDEPAKTGKRRSNLKIIK